VGQNANDGGITQIEEDVEDEVRDAGLIAAFRW
jgi:hypothetical protein